MGHDCDGDGVWEMESRCSSMSCHVMFFSSLSRGRGTDRIGL